MRVVESGGGEVFDIELEEDLLRKNRELAQRNRGLFDRHKVLAIDVMGSIGAGKTSLIERMVEELQGKYRLAAIAGDLTTAIDAERITARGAQVIQANTGKECHLDANLVGKALAELDLDDIDILFIENVGNLICPGEFPLGAHKRLVVVSVTEGPYMVVKHPYIFLDAEVLAINKVDLSEAMGIDPDRLREDALRIKPALKVVKTSCKSGDGVAQVVRALGIEG